MARGGIGFNELSKLKFWQLVASESVGTLLIVVFNNLLISRHDNSSLLLNASITAGLLYTLLLYMFGNHGYFNPAITLSLYVFQRVPLFRMLFYSLSQVLGAVIGQVIARWVILPDNGYSILGNCATIPMEGVQIYKLFLIEVAGMGLISAVISSRCKSYIIGVGVTMATFITFPVSMASLNPARAFAMFLVSAVFPTYSWAYIVAPFAGALLGRFFMLSSELLAPELEHIARPMRRRLLSDSE